MNLLVPGIGYRRPLVPVTAGKPVGMQVDIDKVKTVICLVELWYNEPCVYSGCKPVQGKPTVSECGYRLLFGANGVMSAAKMVRKYRRFHVKRDGSTVKAP